MTTHDKMTPERRFLEFILPGENDDVQDEKEKVEILLALLEPRSREIMKLRHGLKDGTRHELKPVAQAHGITPERVRQIEAKSVTRMRHLSAKIANEASDKEKRTPLSTPIAELNLSVRMQHICERMVIQTIGDLVEKTAEDLYEQRNFSETCLAEVRMALAKIGFRLRFDK